MGVRRILKDAGPRTGPGYALPGSGMSEGGVRSKLGGANLAQLVVAMVLGICGVLLVAAPAKGQFELVGGATYNTYSLDWGTAGAEDSDLAFNSGWGYYAGAHYWINSTLAIGGQIDRFTGSGRERWILNDGQTDLVAGIEGRGTGYLATLAAPIAAHWGLDVTPFVAVGMYRVDADLMVTGKGSGAIPGDVTAKGRLRTASHVGGKFGITVGKEFTPGLVLSGQLAYRLVPAFKELRLEVLGFEREWTADEGIDVSGMSAGIALSYSF